MNKLLTPVLACLLAVVMCTPSIAAHSEIANYEMEWMPTDSLIKTQILGSDYQITADFQGILDSLEVLSGLEGREIASGVINVFALWDSIQSTIEAPVLTVTASELSSGDVSNASSLSLTFSSSKNTGDFAATDITVSNGVISSFAGADDEYTATFTPSGDGVCTIDVAAEVFESLVGTLNEAADQFSWTYDATSPSLTISASEVSTGGTSNDGSLSMTFISSESTTDFASGDVSVTNGTLSDFAGSGVSYTATFTPSGDGATTVDVAGSAFSDQAGNGNNAATQFSWTYDGTAPTMTIVAAEVNDEETSNDASISLTFTSSEAATGLDASDISVTNGTVTNFTAADATTFTATFTPSGDGACTIDLASGAYTDAVGNNNVAADQFSWTFDGTGPTMVISANEVSDGDTSNDAVLSLTFTTNEAATGFDASDVSVTNGAMSNFTAAGATTYTATFTPTGDGACTIDVAGGTFTDAPGNNNSAADQFNWTFDGTVPTMTITADEVASGDASSDAYLNLTFTASESTTDLEAGDIVVSGGDLSGFTALSATVYTAIFTPNGVGDCIVNVPATAFSDEAGNENSDSGDFNWTFTFTCGGANALVFDGYGYETVQIGDQCWFAENLQSEHYANGDPIPGNLSGSDWQNTSEGAQAIYANNTSNLAVYGRMYNWFATTDTRGLCPTGWHVPSDGEWTDLGSFLGGNAVAGDKMKSSPTDNPAWNGNNSSGFSGLPGGGRNFYGNFNSLGDGGNFWSKTPNGEGNGWYRNLHTTNSELTPNHLNKHLGFSVRCLRDTPLSMAITAAEVSDGDASADPSLSLTFTASESTSDFEVSDITVTNGTISNFSGSGSTYTATFTPAGDGACTIDVANSTFTNASGNNNATVDQFNWTFDGTGPTMTITAAEVANDDASNDPSLSLTFTANESTTDFAEGDIELTGGDLSNFTAVSATVYTATFTPLGAGDCTINVPGSAFSDAAGNASASSGDFNWTLLFTCGTTALAYDGYGYETVQIGNQCWFAENLRSENYANGDAIAGNLDDASWNAASTGAQTILQNDAANLILYGRLYNWYAVGDSRGLCPTGWHVAENDAWNTLIGGFGGGGSAGDALKSSISDTPPWNGTNASGFSGVPGGNRYRDGSYHGANAEGYYWTGTGANSSATVKVLESNSTGVMSYGSDARDGYAVRCLRDTPPSMTITAAEVSDGDTSGDATLSLTFNASENTSDFDASGITVTNGTISNFAGSGTTYTATFTPTGDGACTINVADNTFSNANGIGNSAAEEFNWTYASAVSYNYNSFVSTVDYPDVGQVATFHSNWGNEFDPLQWGIVYINETGNAEVSALVGTSGSVTFTQGVTTATLTCSNWVDEYDVGPYMVCAEHNGSNLTVTNANGVFDPNTPFIVTVH